MSGRVVVLGDRETLALTALAPADGFGWAWSGPPEAAGPALGDAELVIGFGAATPGPHAGVLARWLDGAAADAGGGHGRESSRVIAQDGEGLWRRAPWPVADALFGVQPPPTAAPVLVLAPAERTAEAVALLEAYGVPAASASRLTRAALEASIGVICVAAPGTPTPAWVMAPLAARRVLVRVGGSADFGLQAGIDHLAVDALEQAASLAGALVAEPRAFDGVRAFGALTAERHRASTVFARMLTDVRLERRTSPQGERPSRAPVWQPPV